MNKTYLIAIAAALMAAPLVMAHDPNPLATPDGTPKLYCEDRSEWNVHDYGAPATGVLLQGYEDGNVEDCDGITNTGTPCADFEDPADPLSFYAGLCGFNPPVADHDGHAEYAVGGAILLACQTACGVSGVGGGTDGCWGGDEAHHSLSTVTVVDATLGSGATFIVGIDRTAATIPRDPHVVVAGDPTRLLGLEPECGDGLIDRWEDCVGSCVVPFNAGLDGAYYVFVQGSMGHVIT